ncbi:MAG: hypothetical protein ACKPCP_32930 [Sphaerospermopsis kisseleviana]
MTKTEAIASIIIATASALVKVQRKNYHPELEARLQHQLIDAQKQSIEFAGKRFTV